MFEAGRMPRAVCQQVRVVARFGRLHRADAFAFAVAMVFPLFASSGLAQDAVRTLPEIGLLAAPVSPTCVTSPFGPRRRIGPNAVGFHNGIDLLAPAGGAIRAVADGQVVAIHKRGPGGLEILIRHGGPYGFVSLYAHVGLVAPAFAEGKRTVSAGERIGVVGRTGVTYGTHLFFGLLVNGTAIDPEPFLPIARCGKPG